MTELEKTVTLGRGVVLAILMVIGSGLLGLPGLVADSGTVQEVVFGWLLIILAAMPLIQICAGLGKKFPCSGAVPLCPRGCGRVGRVRSNCSRLRVLYSG
ncbi:hypothetical protein [Methanosarcina siciliae]|uniref:hypothetical protein n=1 Tax=Methanosarcina siciliae TaxID=38027 RepID=UPI001E34D672|nr:hypothetical protein [Methanosarcina siciliae]